MDFGSIFWLVSFSPSEQLVVFTFSSLHFVAKLFSSIVQNPICQTHFRALYLNNITHIPQLNCWASQCVNIVLKHLHTQHTLIHSRNKYQSVFTIWSKCTIQFTQSGAHAAACLWCLFMCDFYLSFKVLCFFFGKRVSLQPGWPNESNRFTLLDYSLCFRLFFLQFCLDMTAWK